MLAAVLITLLLAVLGLVAVTMLWSKNDFQILGQTAIITGGSQGFGLSVAKEFAARGANVVIVAQNVPKLKSALEQVRSKALNDKQRFLHLSYDLRSSESGPQIISEVTKWNDGVAPDIVFNCAGNCEPGFFASADIEKHRRQMDTIYWSSAYMAHATLQSWIKPASSGPSSHPTRHLIFTSSVLALFPMAGYSPYTPAKAAMRAMVDGLNQEVAVYNGARASGSEDAPAADIKVHIIFPAGIQTPGYENEQKSKPALTQKLEEEDKPQSPDELAQIVLTGLNAGQYMITSNAIGHIMKGWAMGSSQRTSISDFFWNLVGSIVVVFIGPDFMSKCRNWGKEGGMRAAR